MPLLVSFDLDGTLEDSRADMVAAVHRVRRAIRLEARPDDPALYVERAGLQRLQGSWDAALADLEKAAALDPGRSDLDSLRGQVLLEAGRHAEAEAALRRHLARAPKNRDAGDAYARALESVRKHGPLPVPLHLRNAPTALMRELGYGKQPESAAEEGPSNLPQGLERERFDFPAEEEAGGGS